MRSTHFVWKPYKDGEFTVNVILSSDDDLTGGYECLMIVLDIIASSSSSCLHYMSLMGVECETFC